MHRAAKLWIFFLGLTLSACSPYVESAGPRNHIADIIGEDFLTSDGLRLPLRRGALSTPPKAIILGVHGFNDYGDFLSYGFAQYLQDNDILLITYDQRGFGQNKNRGLWPGSQSLARDLSQLIHLIKAQYEDIPLFVFGESMGGAVAMIALSQTKLSNVQGLILSAPAVWGPSTWPWYQALSLRALSYTLPWLKLSGGGIVQPTDHIKNWKDWSRDPLIITETRVDAIWGVSLLMDMAQKSAAHLHVPSLILYGEKDQVIPWHATQQMIAKLSPQHRIALYSKGWHWLTRDHNGPLVWKDILSWIINPKTTLPSGADHGARERLMKDRK